MDRGDDDGHVLAGKGRVGRDGTRLVRPVADGVDEQAEVAVDPVSVSIWAWAWAWACEGVCVCLPKTPEEVDPERG